MIARKYNLLNLLNKSNSVLILGPRGSGKSFFVNSILDSTYPDSSVKINLLSTSDFNTYLNSPELLSKQVRQRITQSNKKICVFIDEIQLIPALLNEVHLLIEELKSKAVFILTGSSARKLKREKANLLAGRALLIKFYPISNSEINFDPILDKILRYGSLPRVITELDTEVIELYLKTYTTTYLKEEIQQEALVRNLPAFSRFLELAAQYNGQHVNFSKLSRTIKVSPNTISGYFSILEETLMIKSVPAWTHSIKLQLQQAPKFYFFDNGVLRSLTGELRSELSEGSLRYGVMFENMVVNEIIRQISILKSDYKIYSFRTKTNQEIDLVLQKGPFDDPIGIEIKSSKNPTAKDVSALYCLKKENKNARLIVLCQCKEAYTENNIEFFPYQRGIEKILQPSPDYS